MTKRIDKHRTPTVREHVRADSAGFPPRVSEHVSEHAYRRSGQERA